MPADGMHDRICPRRSWSLSLVCDNDGGNIIWVDFGVPDDRLRGFNLCIPDIHRPMFCPAWIQVNLFEFTIHCFDGDPFLSKRIDLELIVTCSNSNMCFAIFIPLKLLLFHS